MNIQHPTTYNQHPVRSHEESFSGCWRFPLLFLALPLQAQTNDLPPLSPAYPELPPTFWVRHQSAIIVAGFAVAAFAFFVLKQMLRPTKEVLLPPITVAKQALAKLQNEPEDGNVLSAVSQILRRYVSTTFELPDNELTTSEFCKVIDASPKIGKELAQSISSFLQECDVRKFSPPNAAAPLDAVNRALKLIALAEEFRTKANAPTAISKQ